MPRDDGTQEVPKRVGDYVSIVLHISVG